MYMHTFDFSFITGSSSISLFKGVCWNAPLSLSFPLWTIASPILQPHVSSLSGEHFRRVAPTLGVTGRGLGLACWAPLFTLVGEFRVQLGVTRWGHHWRGTYHHLLLWFGTTEKEKTEHKNASSLSSCHLLSLSLYTAAGTNKSSACLASSNCYLKNVLQSVLPTLRYHYLKKKSSAAATHIPGTRQSHGDLPVQLLSIKTMVSMYNNVPHTKTSTK